GDELRDRSFQSLPSGIGDLTIIELKRAEMGELLGDGRVEAAHGNFLLRHRFHLWGVAAAEIARAGCQWKKRQCDNEQPSQNPVCSTHSDRLRQPMLAAFLAARVFRAVIPRREDNASPALTEGPPSGRGLFNPPLCAARTWVRSLGSDQDDEHSR